MRWQSGRRSDNIEDIRGQGGGLGRNLKLGGGATLIIGLIGFLITKDPRMLTQVFQGGGQLISNPSATNNEPLSAEQEKAKDFVAVILGDTEDMWSELFAKTNKTYEKPKLVLFTDGVESACGMSSAASGPFYCPGDHKVYLDLSFFAELSQRFKAPGDFAQAYVIAHEVGHHVQTLLGISAENHAARARASEKEANALSVRQELQADCFAGVWAHHADKARSILESGDVEEGLTAATVIGDDALQKQARGVVVPESFTHGSSAQRVRWFKTGLEFGDLNRCDTFSATNI